MLASERPIRQKNRLSSPMAARAPSDNATARPSHPCAWCKQPFECTTARIRCYTRLLDGHDFCDCGGSLVFVRLPAHVPPYFRPVQTIYHNECFQLAQLAPERLREHALEAIARAGLDISAQELDDAPQTRLTRRS